MARVSKPKGARIAKAQVKKTRKAKAAVHAAHRPKPVLRRPAPRLAALAPPKGYPDQRLMMTRTAPAPAETQYALIRTTTCVSGAPVGRLMPLLITAPPEPTESFLPVGDETLFVPPPPGPPLPVGGGGIDIFPPPPPPPGPPGAIPEPSTWALLILGFGMVGAGLRRRRAFTS